MMQCKICSSNADLVFSQKPICMWTGNGDLSSQKFPVQLYQCAKCGHIFQVLEPSTLKQIESVYESNNAQASTQLGEGNWGKIRAEKFLRFLPHRHYSSILEIGCGNGYLLNYFYQKGVKTLVGIEPSLEENYNQNGIRFLKTYATSSLVLAHKFDLIFASAVFEHIDDIIDTLLFCTNQLTENGVLYFSVPNSELDILKNDPALFAHEHIHYFSRSSLLTLCDHSDLTIHSIAFENDSLYVHAEKKRKEDSITSHSYPYPNLFLSYQHLLQSISNLQQLFKRHKKILIHGATNATHNMIQWCELENASFTLVDNDETKHAKAFFKKVVKPFHILDPNEYDCIIIAAIAYFDEIKHDYILHGFTNTIYPLNDIAL